MQPVNQQKAILIVAVLAVVALLATTFFSNGFMLFNLSEQEKHQIAKTQEGIKASVKFSPDSGVDEAASKLIWQQVLDPEQMKQEITAELGVDIPYKPIVVDEGKLNIVDESSESAVADYFKNLSSLVGGYKQYLEPNLPVVWGYDTDQGVAYQVAKVTDEVVKEMYEMPVPKPATEFHKNLLAGMQANNSYVKDNDLALRNLLPRGNQWQGTANTMIAFKDSSLGVEQESKTLALLYPGLDKKLAEEKGFFSTKEARALGYAPPTLPSVPGVGGGVPVVTTTDWPRFFRELLQSIIAVATTNYAKNRILSYIEGVENQFLITNYLFYTDALVDQKYATSFLEKYVDNPKQRQVIKQLLPQFSCGKTDVEAVKKTLRDEALSYLGYDPKNLDYRDPNLYDKIVESSAPSSTGAAINADAALLFNRSLAIVTEFQAQRAANQELIAPGKKVPVTNDQKKNIQVSLDYLTSKMQSAIKTVFDFVLPTSATTGKEGMASLVVSAVGQIIQQFGVANAVVLKEQQTCIGGGAAVFNPIVPPNPGTGDVNIPSDYIQQCVSNPSSCGLILSQRITRKYS